MHREVVIIKRYRTTPGYSRSWPERTLNLLSADSIIETYMPHGDVVCDARNLDGLARGVEVSDPIQRRHRGYARFVAHQNRTL
jgi:hypothetical protein